MAKKQQQARASETQAPKVDGDKAMINVIHRFGYSFDGLTVVYFEPGEQEVPTEVANHALATEKAELATE